MLMLLAGPYQDGLAEHSMCTWAPLLACKIVVRTAHGMHSLAAGAAPTGVSCDLGQRKGSSCARELAYLHGGFSHQHLLEATLKGSVLLHVQPVLCEGCGADAVQLAARQHGLQQVCCRTPGGHISQAAGLLKTFWQLPATHMACALQTSCLRFGRGGLDTGHACGMRIRLSLCQGMSEYLSA